MKKQFLFLFALFVCATGSVKSQGFFTRLDAGYATSFAKDVVGNVGIVDTLGNASLENIYTTFGQGPSLGLGLGYMFNQHIGVEIWGQYLWGSRKLAQSSDNPAFGLSIMAEAYTRQMRIVPSLILNTGGEKISGFVRMGPFVPVAGATYVESVVRATGQAFDQETHSTLKNQGQFSIGFHAAGGIEYKLSDMLSLNLEIQAIQLGIRTESAEVTASTTTDLLTGETTDNLDGLNTYNRFINYQDRLDQDSNNPDVGVVDPDLPADELRELSSYNSVGINLGVKVMFRK